MAATITETDGQVGWTATMDIGKARMIVVPAAPQPVRPGRTPELWLIPHGGRLTRMNTRAAQAAASSAPVPRVSQMPQPQVHPQPVARAAGRRVELQRRAAALPEPLRRHLRRDLLRQRQQAPVPLRFSRRRCAARGQFLLDRGAGIGIEHAEHVLGVAQFAIFLVGRSRHVSRHVRSCSRARRIQLFIVASGT